MSSISKSSRNSGRCRVRSARTAYRRCDRLIYVGEEGRWTEPDVQMRASWSAQREQENINGHNGSVVAGSSIETHSKQNPSNSDDALASKQTSDVGKDCSAVYFESPGRLEEEMQQERELAEIQDFLLAVELDQAWDH